ncbi:porphobilinogen deaminase [Phellopilus nigrolimitatus]|nr:porphobilinogen deaminase [Phellopilus nigrolimitatus]
MSSEPASRTVTFTLASRASQLAQIQTHIVRDTLVTSFPTTTSQKYVFATSFMRTAGDKNQVQALYVLGGGADGKALWTEELEAALLRAPDESVVLSGVAAKGADDDDAPAARVDMLVHSLKDVPTTLPAGCTIGAILKREDPVDCLVVKQGLTYKSLDDLPKGSVVGTSSVRRVAQLKRKYPGLQFADVRGNLNTRMAKLDSPEGPYVAIILAKAGLVRLGMGARITADVGVPVLYHAVGQGALAVEVREGDAAVGALCKVLNHQPTEWKCRAERAMLRVLEGGCSVPVGVHSELAFVGGDEKAKLTITGTVTALDGTRHVEYTLEADVGSAEDAESAGERLARTLMENGAKEILVEITADKAARRAAEASENPKTKTT